jgi:hypothetical protein
MSTSKARQRTRPTSVVSPLKRDAGFLDTKIEMGYDKYLKK